MVNQIRLFWFFTFIFIIAGVYLALIGFWAPYSYWWDELYSVVGANKNLNEMFTLFILLDVHPPLYQIIFKVWIHMFGDSENATRSLSLIFALLSIVLLFLWSKKRFDDISTGLISVLFSTNWMFAYYSQKSRSYAM